MIAPRPVTAPIAPVGEYLPALDADGLVQVVVINGKRLSPVYHSITKQAAFLDLAEAQVLLEEEIR